MSGQTFTSASFTLANATQCQGGSPRFNVATNVTTFFLGCNNVTPTLNTDGTATYTFTAATIAAGGNQVPVPTGTISSVDVLIDVQGTADLSNITFKLPDRGARHDHERSDLEGPVQARRLEVVHVTVVQESGPVRQLVRASL